MSGYETVVLDRFLGLDLSEGFAYDPAYATSATDVTIGEGGRSIRRRRGYDNHTASAAAAPYIQLYPHSDSILLARRSTTLAAVNTSGAEATTTTVANAFTHATQIGTPSASYSYIADGSSAIIQYDGSSFTAGTALATVDGVGSRAMPKGNFVTVTGSSNRLVVAGTASSGGPNGVTSGGSYVWFSDPGAPTTWDTDNFVQLDPGDGESIVGCVTWRDQVFVFKKTKLFIFYSESTDSSGNPVFNYRSVDLGVQAEIMTPTAATGNGTVTSGPNGVYYVGPQGVWVTTGDVPAPVSTSLWSFGFDPSGHDIDFYGFFGEGRCGIHYHLGRIFVSFFNLALSYRMLVYDERAGGWVIWNAAQSGFATWKNGGSEPLLVGGGTGVNHIYKWSNASTTYNTDDGTSIGNAAYTTGLWDLGFPGEKTIREVELWGVGTATIELTPDDDSTRTKSTTVTFGSATTINRVFARSLNVRGNYFTIAIGDVDGAYFRINRIILHLRESRNAGAKSV